MAQGEEVMETKYKITVAELPLKCKKCAMRRHRVGLVRECEYICPEEESSTNALTMLTIGK